MPLKRTPPTPVTKSARLAPKPNIASEPDLYASDQDVYSDSFVTHRTIRHTSTNSEEQMSLLMTDMKTMFSELSQKQDKKMERIYSTMEEIKNQNNNIRSTLEFLSNKYDSLLQEFNDLKLTNSQNKKYIQNLEDKIEKLEQSSRSTCLEIKNFPVKKAETKTCLLQTVTEIGNILKVPIHSHDIKDVFRIRTKNPENKTIIVELSSVLMKQKIISLYKKFNKENSKLSTEHLKISGPPKPIFISENLSAKMKRLFYLARVCASSNGYKYCWTSKGKIFIRERDGTNLHLINEESDLQNLVKHI